MTPKNPAAVALGRKGGQARADRMTKEQRSEAARKAVTARWMREHEQRMKAMDKSLVELEKTGATIAEGTKKLKKLTQTMERNKKARAKKKAAKG